MSIDRILARGRRQRERLRMRAMVLIEDVSSGPIDPYTGQAAPVTVYEGRAHIHSHDPAEADIESAGASVADVSADLHIPWSVTGVEAGHRVTVLSDPDKPANEGRRMRIEARGIASQTTALTFRISEVTG